MIFKPLLFILTVICLSFTIFFLFVPHFNLTYLSFFPLSFPHFSAAFYPVVFFFLSLLVALFHLAWTDFLSWFCFRYISSLFNYILILMYYILFCLFSSSLCCLFVEIFFLSAAIFRLLWTAYLAWIILAFPTIFHHVDIHLLFSFVWFHHFWAAFILMRVILFHFHS